MIYALYTLMEKYKDKKIYIWDISRESIILFTRAVFRRIDIAGFAVMKEEYAGDIFMNRPVITLEQVKEDKNSVILTSDEVTTEINSMLPADKVIYWAEAMRLDDELRSKRIIVYGTGIGAEQVEEVLSKEGLEVDLYCITKKRDLAWYKGKKIIDVTELKDYEDHAVIISVLIPRYKLEILEALSKFPGCVYMDMKAKNMSEEYMTNIIQNLDAAIKNRNKIYLYSKRDIIAELIEEVLSIYGVKVSGYVYEMSDREQSIESIYAVTFDGVEDKFIIINAARKADMIRARENVELAGFSLEEGNYASFQRYTIANEIMLSKWKGYNDPLVGNSIFYTEGEVGWKLYGKGEGIRILVLGGSTSSEHFKTENWISKLYYKFLQNNIETVIYNGAHPGNDIVTEMLRLLRDGHVLQPQIVISMSGVNNTDYKECGNQFNDARLINWVRTLSPNRAYCSGVSSDESLYSFWSRNVQLLRLISEFLGARFVGFLQPMNITMESMTLQEKSLFDSEAHRRGARDFAQYANDHSGYINLMRLFEHQNGMFIDGCHYTEKAHEIIADNVYEKIMPVIRDI